MLVVHEVQYVDLEIFVVKIFLVVCANHENKKYEIFLQRIIMSTKNSYG